MATYETWYNAHYATLDPPINGKELFLVGATGGIWTVNPNTDNWLTTMLSPGHLADKVDGIEIHDYIVRTPALYVFKMFVPHHVDGAKWMPSTLESEDITGNGKTFPVVSSAATVNDAGELSISLVNVDLVSTREVTVTVATDRLGYTLESAEIITGDAKDSYNDFGEAQEVNIQPLADSSYELCGRKLKVTLPSKSVVMFRLTPVEGSVASSCPEGPSPPAGDCTESAELCPYGDMQCVCQAGQQGASWQCGSCPAVIASGDVCAVTGMTCGDCTCEQTWQPGGQRAWSFVCAGP